MRLEGVVDGDVATVLVTAEVSGAQLGGAGWRLMVIAVAATIEAPVLEERGPQRRRKRVTLYTNVKVDVECRGLEYKRLLEVGVCSQRTGPVARVLISRHQPTQPLTRT